VVGTTDYFYMPAEASEEKYLRHLIEKQPACLLRVRRDGVLLACNDAGLSLLGKEELVEVLDRPLTEHLVPEQHGTWPEFSERVWAAGSGSVECTLAKQPGEIRSVLFHAIALRDHPDRGESLLVTARDISALRRLERALESAQDAGNASLQEARGKVAELEAELSRAIDESTRLSTVLDEHRAGDNRAAERLAELEVDLAKAVDEAARLTAVLNEHRDDLNEHRDDNERMRGRVTELETALGDALAETARLAAAREVHDADLERARGRVAELEAEFTRTTEEAARLAASFEERRAEGEREARERQAQLEVDLVSATEETSRLTSVLEGRRAEYGRASARVAELEAEIAQWVEEVARLTTALDDRRAEADREARERQAQLEADLARAAEEAARQTSALADRQADYERASAQVRDLEARLARTADETGRLTAALEERRAEGTRHDQAVDEARARIAQLDAEVGGARGEKAHLESLLEAAGRERQRRDAEYLAALAQMKQDLDRAREEVARLQDADRDVAAARSKAETLERALADAEAQLARALEEQRQLAATIDGYRADRQKLEDLQEVVALAVDDRKRVTTLLARAEADQQRLAAEHAADRQAVERTLGEAIFKKNQLLKTLADQRVELQQWFDQACALEPLAAAGRLAVDVGGELDAALAAVADRTEFILSLSHLETSYRAEVESLRTDALRASSLARQLATSRPERTSERAPERPTVNVRIAETRDVR
jgi:chromosome segregation ATPase